MPLILTVDPYRPDPASLDLAAETLRQGGILAYPTETLYGLGVDPFREDALDRLFRLKGRPAGTPVSVLVRDMEMLQDLVEDVPPRARIVLERFLPGPLTAVLCARGHLPVRLTGGTGKIGVRISPHPVLRHLFDRFPHPVTTTSANRAGRPPAVDAEQARDAFPEGIDCILDAGPAPGGIGSTVVDLTGPDPLILREGALSREELFRCLGESASGKGMSRGE